MAGSVLQSAGKVGPAVVVNVAQAVSYRRAPLRQVLRGGIQVVEAVVRAHGLGRAGAARPAHRAKGAGGGVVVIRVLVHVYAHGNGVFDAGHTQSAAAARRAVHHILRVHRQKHQANPVAGIRAAVGGQAVGVEKAGDGKIVLRGNLLRQHLITELVLAVGHQLGVSAAGGVGSGAAGLRVAIQRGAGGHLAGVQAEAPRRV